MFMEQTTIIIIAILIALVAIAALYFGGRFEISRDPGGKLKLKVKGAEKKQEKPDIEVLKGAKFKDGKVGNITGKKGPAAANSKNQEKVIVGNDLEAEGTDFGDITGVDTTGSSSAKKKKD